LKRKAADAFKFYVPPPVMFARASSDEGEDESEQWDDEDSEASEAGGEAAGAGQGAGAGAAQGTHGSDDGGRYAKRPRSESPDPETDVKVRILHTVFRPMHQHPSRA